VDPTTWQGVIFARTVEPQVANQPSAQAAAPAVYEAAPPPTTEAAPPPADVPAEAPTYDAPAAAPAYPQEVPTYSFKATQAYQPAAAQEAYPPPVAAQEAYPPPVAAQEAYPPATYQEYHATQEVAAYQPAYQPAAAQEVYPPATYQEYHAAQAPEPAQAQAPEPAALPVDELAIAPPNDPSWRAEPPTAVAHTMSQMAALVQDCEAGDQQACDALELIEDERQNEPELLGGGELMSQSDDMESFRNAPARHSKPVGAWALGGASRGAQLKKKKWKGPVDTTVVVR
jgi:hypothetical protein